MELTQNNWFITQTSRTLLTWLNWAAAAAAWKFLATKSSDDTGKYGAAAGVVLNPLAANNESLTEIKRRILITVQFIMIL